MASALLLFGILPQPLMDLRRRAVATGFLTVTRTHPGNGREVTTLSQQRFRGSS
jgi:hypothetical protein